MGACNIEQGHSQNLDDCARRHQRIRILLILVSTSVIKNHGKPQILPLLTTYRIPH